MSKYRDQIETRDEDDRASSVADMNQLRFNSRVAAEQARQESLLPRGRRLSMGDRMMIAAAMAKADSEGRAIEAPDLSVAPAKIADRNTPAILVAGVMAPFAKAKSLKDVATAADHLLGAVRNQVPPEIYARISNICESVKAGLTLHENDPLKASVADHDIFRLQQSVLDYIPTVVDAYLAVPQAYADRPVAGKKSASEYLSEQVETIEAACAGIVDQMVAAENSNLEGNGRFLRDIFGSAPAKSQPSPSRLDTPGSSKVS